MSLSLARLTTTLRKSIARPWLATDRPAVPWALLVGGAVLAAYLALVPFVERTWRTTGDEPHYLLATHSLVVDGDYDLRNNYDQRDYLAFYFSPDLDRQIRYGPSGAQILNHHPGLPFLLAPAYALGGRLGVLVFQAVLGGILAALTFKLALLVSGDEKASLWATLFVAFSPPLLMYHYLIYPEAVAALATTLVLYAAIDRQPPGRATTLAAMASLLALPWLNRRFVPLALVLALLLAWAWRGWRGPGGWGRGLWGLLLTGLSIGLVLWLNSQLAAPARSDITAPTGVSAFYRLARGVGWLVDQQKGLFVYAPIYLLAVWGLPPLLERAVRARDRDWWVLWPFALSLGGTALAGGYWIAWELGPRFLVVALPALAPVLALAWQRYARFRPVRYLALALFVISLGNSLVILRQPSIPYRSTLPLFYEEKLGLPLPQLLPALADYTRISPDRAAPGGDKVAAGATVVPDGGAPVWFVEAGRSSPLLTSVPLVELPYGPYRLRWPVRTEPGLPPATELMRVSINLLGGGQVRLANGIVTAADLQARGDGGAGQLELAFVNPSVDRWRTPPVLHAVSTGQADIWAGDIVISPDPFYAWVLPYFYLICLLAGAVLSWRWSGANPDPGDAGVRVRLPGLSPGVGWGLALGLILAAGTYVVWQGQQPGRTYDVEQLFHFTGQSLPDPAASDGRAWLVDPDRDPPERAVSGPFDLFDPGLYHVTFRIKLLEPPAEERDLALLQVRAAAGQDELVSQPLRREHFSDLGAYHEFVLTVRNPRRQSLSFEAHYLGVAPLAIDGVTVTRLAE